MAPTDPSCAVPPVPSLVTITSCISTSGGHGVILTWSCPRGGYEAFELQVGGQDSQNTSSCGMEVNVLGLWPAQSYPATVMTLWDGMRARSASVICHTENTDEQSPMGTRTWNGQLAEPYCQGHGPWKWGRSKCPGYPGDTFARVSL